mmetsp:Transcript_45175/g.88370  ORF Transcript_45175/g.88370 Transcript_45175/m.88370 type:complete len:244 (+) Transcript_45175:607-1338(+)
MLLPTSMGVNMALLPTSVRVNICASAAVACTSPRRLVSSAATRASSIREGSAYPPPKTHSSRDTTRPRIAPDPSRPTWSSISFRRTVSAAPPPAGEAPAAATGAGGDEFVAAAGTVRAFFVDGVEGAAAAEMLLRFLVFLLDGATKISSSSSSVTAFAEDFVLAEDFALAGDFADTFSLGAAFFFFAGVITSGFVHVSFSAAESSSDDVSKCELNTGVGAAAAGISPWTNLQEAPVLHPFSVA